MADRWHLCSEYFTDLLQDRTAPSSPTFIETSSSSEWELTFALPPSKRPANRGPRQPLRPLANAKDLCGDLARRGLVWAAKVCEASKWLLS